MHEGPSRTCSPPHHTRTGAMHVVPFDTVAGIVAAPAALEFVVTHLPEGDAFARQVSFYIPPVPLVSPPPPPTPPP